MSRAFAIFTHEKVKIEVLTAGHIFGREKREIQDISLDETDIFLSVVI